MRQQPQSRLTQEDIDNAIKNVYFINAGDAALPLVRNGPAPHGSPLDVMTVCFIELQNGFIVTGESACVDPDNYVKEIGERIALANAKEKIWLLEGYKLKHLQNEWEAWNG